MSLSVSCVQTRSSAINLGLANKSPGSKSVYEKRCDNEMERKEGGEEEEKRAERGEKESGKRKCS